jgi:hypothetical protein
VYLNNNTAGFGVASYLVKIVDSKVIVEIDKR